MRDASYRSVTMVCGWVACVVAPAIAFACGGTKPPTDTTPQTIAPTTPTTPTVASAAPTAPPTPTASASSGDTTAQQHFAMDVTEHGSTTTLPALFDATVAKTTFPKATVGDRECWQTVSLSGDHQKDYDAILAKCGAPTGLREYTKPVTGRLHHVHDKRDTYRIKLAAGFCYRYFAVADAKVSDLDILVETTTGALVADDRTKQPVAIIENDKPWCIDDAKEFDYHIEIDGVGEGFYTFGVWARPKK